MQGAQGPVKPTRKKNRMPTQLSQKSEKLGYEYDNDDILRKINKPPDNKPDGRLINAKSLKNITPELQKVSTLMSSILKEGVPAEKRPANSVDNLNYKGTTNETGEEKKNMVSMIETELKKTSQNLESSLNQENMLKEQNNNTSFDGMDLSSKINGILNNTSTPKLVDYSPNFGKKQGPESSLDSSMQQNVVQTSDYAIENLTLDVDFIKTLNNFINLKDKDSYFVSSD
jgi:hypothetical protein